MIKESSENNATLGNRYIKIQDINNIQNMLVAYNFTTPEPPVIRMRDSTFNQNVLQLIISEQNEKIKGKSKKDLIKVSELYGEKIIHVSKDVSFKIGVKYMNISLDDLNVRIYPSSTDPAFRSHPIVCCTAHGQDAKTKVKEKMLDYAKMSICELNDDNVKYEMIELPSNESQISAIAPFWCPDIWLELILKCYNTCHGAFKKSHPKLNFAIEKCIEPNRKYVVLSEVGVLFKVSSSPSRDSYRLTLRKRAAEEQANVAAKSASFSGNYIELNGEKYVPKMVSESMLKLMESIHEYSPKVNPEVDSKLENIERLMSQNLANIFSELYEDLENKYGKIVINQ